MKVSWPRSDHGKIILSLLVCIAAMAPMVACKYAEERRKEEQFLRDMAPKLEKPRVPKFDQYDYAPSTKEAIVRI
jgi:hypothetical protein